MKGSSAAQDVVYAINKKVFDVRSFDYDNKCDKYGMNFFLKTDYIKSVWKQPI
jgi:hypothetical protein